MRKILISIISSGGESMEKSEWYWNGWRVAKKEKKGKKCV
jgi:hypothetical protein